jgi:hypothetical protein
VETGGNTGCQQPGTAVLGTASARLKTAASAGPRQSSLGEAPPNEGVADAGPRRHVLTVTGNAGRPTSWARILALSLLSAFAAACGLAPGQASSAATANPDVVALRELQAPVLSAAKTATTKLAAGDLSGAADELAAIGSAGKKILDWLDAHAAFTQANAPTAACLRETMADLGEQAESLVPHLRAGNATTAQISKLRLDLGEAANCIQTGD